MAGCLPPWWPASVCGCERPDGHLTSVCYFNKPVRNVTVKYYWVCGKIYGCVGNKVTSLSKHHALQRDGGFITREWLRAAVSGGALSASRSNHRRGIHTRGRDVVGAWVCPTDGMDVTAERKILFPDWASNFGHPAYRQSADWVIVAFISIVRWFLKKIFVSVPLSTRGLWWWILR